MTGSKILVLRRDGTTLIKVIGRGSFENAGCLRNLYQESLRDGVSRFVLDLGACTGLDSTFLGILLGLGLKLKATGGHAHILNAHSQHVELFNSLGLDRLFQFGHDQN